MTAPICDMNALRCGCVLYSQANSPVSGENKEPFSGLGVT